MIKESWIFRFFGTCQNLLDKITNAYRHTYRLAHRYTHTQHTSFYFASGYYILHFWSFFYKLKVCGYPVWNKSIGTLVAAVFAHFVSLCRI